MVNAGSSVTTWRALFVETARCSREKITMRILLTALLALSVLAGIAAPASAFDVKSLFGQQERESGGSSGG
jgi:hypothetical protein